ncbi:MAG TPA: ROK family protein [Candidatus Angelobacter sp.]|nr:ROK family protein [Candidatus Angelobacter sp.]
MRALAIDLGGTHATCAVVEDRELKASITLPMESSRGLRPALPLFVDAFRKLMDQTGLKLDQCAGLAFGFAGLVSFKTGRVVSTNQKYDDALEVDLPAWCKESLGLPLRIENDARMALLGEYYAGAAQGFSDVVMMTLGTGIGGAAMIEGKLLRGKHSQAGCLGGHIPVLFTGRRCTCGNIGCAEAEASGWALPLIVKGWPGVRESTLAKHESPGFLELFDAAGKGDPVAEAIRNRCLHVWAAAASGLIHMYDPEIVVVGGGVMKSGAVILPYMQNYVSTYPWTPWGKVQVRAASLGNHAGLLGAIPLLTESN